MKKSDDITVVSTRGDSPVIHVGSRVQQQNRSFVWSTLLTVIITSCVIMVLEYWRLHNAAQPVPFVQLPRYLFSILLFSLDFDFEVFAGYRMVEDLDANDFSVPKPTLGSNVKPGRHQQSNFLMDPSKPDPNDPYFQGKSAYPAVIESIRPFFGANYYCGIGGFGSGEDCDGIFDYAKGFRERRKAVDGWMLTEPGSDMGRTMELIEKPRKLKLFVAKEWWILDQVFDHIDGSKCRFPIEIVHNDSGNDLRLTFNGEFAERAKHQLHTPYEPWSPVGKTDEMTMSFHRKSDIWATYWPRDYGKECDYNVGCLFYPSYVDQKYAAELRKSRTSLGALFISNCNDMMAKTRTRFVTELAKHIPIDSYGGCTPNGTNSMSESKVDWSRLIPGIKDPTRSQKKAALSYTYNFSFAFENNLREDYISEKFFDGIASGNVLVVFGANNAEDFAPNKLSFINALHFLHPRYLASYLKVVNENQWIYQEFMKFRTQEIRNPLFLELQKNSLWDVIEPPGAALCRISEQYAKMWGSG
jgi:hypothetical protein